MHFKSLALHWQRIKAPTKMYYKMGVQALGTSEFDAQMSAIKIWMGDENLRPVHKKPF
jgi:hypothetical protein